MGKLATMITILVIMDIIFIVTGQLDVTSSLSLVTGALLNPSAIRTSAFFALFFGIAGIAGLLAQSGTTTGFLVTATNVLAFTVMAIAMTGLLGDFVTIFITLSAYNFVLATIIMSPIMMLFILTVAEWLRGKD